MADQKYRAFSLNPKGQQRQIVLFCVSIAKLLLEKRANVNYRYEEGFAPLMAAAEDGSVEMVKLLLAHGADVNARAKDGKTALAFAAARNHHDVFELLKSYGAKE